MPLGSGAILNGPGLVSVKLLTRVGVVASANGKPVEAVTAV